MYKIKNKYMNEKGEIFNSLRTIRVASINDLPKKKFPVFNQEISLDYDDIISEKFDIYKSIINSDKAFRIYKDLKSCYEDDRLVYELQKRQKRVKLTDFPTAIIVVDGYDKDVFSKVVGQEIVYYSNSISSFNYFSNAENINYIKIYLDILKILRELLDNGIYYSDIHPGNFVINRENETVKLIDFEIDSIIFDDIGFEEIKHLLLLTKNLIIRLCELGNIKLFKSLKNVETLNELEEYLVLENQKVLKR